MQLIAAKTDAPRRSPTGELARWLVPRVRGGSRPAVGRSGAPLKISMITPRSQSVPRYATLRLPNSPPRIAPFPAVGLLNGLVEVRSSGVGRLLGLKTAAAS